MGPSFEHRLPLRGVLRIDRGGALAITCTQGLLWVTRTGDGNDHVLRAGERLVLQGEGRVVAEALKAAAFRVEDADGDTRIAA